jgi:hypothetical protein
MKTLKNLLIENQNLIYTCMQKVESHVQRQQDNWILNTVLINGYDVPFKYKRQRMYRSLKGLRVDLIYYASSEKIAGIDFEMMNVIKINRS